MVLDPIKCVRQRQCYNLTFSSYRQFKENARFFFFFSVLFSFFYLVIKADFFFIFLFFKAAVRPTLLYPSINLRGVLSHDSEHVAIEGQCSF